MRTDDRRQRARDFAMQHLVPSYLLHEGVAEEEWTPYERNIVDYVETLLLAFADAELGALGAKICPEDVGIEEYVMALKEKAR